MRLTSRASGTGIGDFNLERETEVIATANSARGAAAAGRTLYPLITAYLTFAKTEGGHDTWWIDATLERWDALISVWWDEPPAEDE